MPPRDSRLCHGESATERGSDLRLPHSAAAGALGGAPAQAGPENSASMVTSTLSPTPMVVPGWGMPKAIPKPERLNDPWAEKPTYSALFQTEGM
jgi:hypothetical protein